MGIELSARQLQILEKRRNKSSPQQSEESLNLLGVQQQQPQTNQKPFQTRSNISEISNAAGNLEPTSTVLSSKRPNEPKTDESQRQALRSMITMSSKRTPTTVLDTSSASNHHYKDDVGKALLKKVLQQQKTYVGPGSNLREQLRERLHSKRSGGDNSTAAPKMVPLEKQTDPQSHKVMPSSSQLRKNQSHSHLSPSPESSSPPTAFVTSEGYKRFMVTLQQEVSGQHTHLFAAFTTAVGYDADLPTMQATSPKVTKLDDQTVLQLQTMNELLKSTYGKTVECRGKSQLINDKKYVKEQRAMAKKGVKTKPLVTETKNVAGENFREESRKEAIVTSTRNESTKHASDMGEMTKHSATADKKLIATLTGKQLQRVKVNPSKYPPSDKNPTVATNDLEVHDVIHVDYQDLPTLSEDPILQTRSSGSVRSRKDELHANLKVEIPAYTEAAVGRSTRTESTAKDASKKAEAAPAKRISLPPPGASPVPWVGIQLRSVADARDAEEKRAEKTPFWASVNLRPVSRTMFENGQDPRIGLAADSPIVVDSDSLSSKNNFPSSPSETASYGTGPRQDGKIVTGFTSKTSDVLVSESRNKSVSSNLDNTLDTIAPPHKSSEQTVRSDGDQPIDASVVVIRLKTDLADEKHEYRVIIGTRMIRKIKGEPGGSNAVVCWNLPREDMEHDGMTLNMPTLKVTLLLKRGKGSCKVLCFDDAADCLRFAAAFYNMSAVPTSTDNAAPPVSEISDAASDVDSSVRLESLNDEEQNVLERYRELRQSKSAQEALSGTLSLASLSQSLVETSVSVSASLEEQELIQKYRKMLKLGAPLGAVQHKMKLDNVPAHIHEALIEEAEKRAPPTFVDTLPNSPISTFTSSTVGEGEKLNEEEEKIAESYRLLLKRGLPADAVRHKLTRDAVDIKIVHAVFGVSGLAQRSQAPSEIRNSRLSDAENVIAEKYRKMLKMGIPSEGVRHKMTQDQVNRKIIAALFQTDEAEESKEAETMVEPGKLTSKIFLSQEEESIASQYRKLLKLQIPRDAVMSRMEKEGVSEKIISAVVGCRLVSSKPSNDSSAASRCGSTGSNLINLHWNAMDDVPAGSVWEETSKKSSEPERSDISTLVALFQKKKPTSVIDEKKNDAASSKSKAKLLDLTRSNNLAISLKAFKEFSLKELADIIGFLDPKRKIRGERAHFVRDLLPSAPEMKIISEYNGIDERLVPAELWFRHLRGIKRLDTKVQVIRTMEMFTSEIKTVEQNFRLLDEVCHQVMGSVKLQDLLGMVLRIGNVMNEGTRTGGAAGFRFDSLLRLTQTKTSDGKITVLDYLVTVFIAKGQRDTLDLESDFPECHTASRFLISDMTNEVKLLKEALEQCKKELQDLERDQSPPPRKENEAILIDDRRGQLFASILSRGVLKDIDDLPPRPPGQRGDVFAKREAFLAAIASSSSPKTPPAAIPDKGTEIHVENTAENENSLAGGTTRLRNFIEEVKEPFLRLEKQRERTLEACKDLSTYCGESGGVGSTTMLLGVLSAFAKNIESALRKYDNQQEDHTRKQKTRNTQSSTSVSHDEEMDGKKTSLIVLVSDVLRNANPKFKEDFKKGRTIPNPTKSLKALYEREKSATRSPQKLDIVSAIREREEAINADDGLQQHARSTFAGAQQMTPVPAKETMSTSGQTSERFVSVRDRASLLKVAPNSQLLSAETRHDTSTAKHIKSGNSSTCRLEAPFESASQIPVTADGQVLLKNPASSSPPMALYGCAEYPTRTPPLPTGKPNRLSATASGSGSQSKDRKSLAERARERRLERKSASRSSSLDERRHAVDDAPTQSQTAVARSARQNRLY